MNLGDSIRQARDGLRTAERRAKALEALAEAGLGFEPAGADIVVLHVKDDREARPTDAIQAMRLREGEWLWLDFANHAVTGPWADLITLVTNGTRYPVAMSKGQVSSTDTFATGVSVDPREPR